MEEEGERESQRVQRNSKRSRSAAESFRGLTLSETFRLCERRKIDLVASVGRREGSRSLRRGVKYSS